jgi:hypothetical protein
MVMEFFCDELLDHPGVDGGHAIAGLTRLDAHLFLIGR